MKCLQPCKPSSCCHCSKLSCCYGSMSSARLRLLGNFACWSLNRKMASKLVAGLVWRKECEESFVHNASCAWILGILKQHKRGGEGGKMSGTTRAAGREKPSCGWGVQCLFNNKDSVSGTLHRKCENSSSRSAFPKLKLSFEWLDLTRSRSLSCEFDWS